MTWSDPIVDEVRRVRDAYAARFNYDLRAIYRDLKQQEKRSGRRVVSGSKCSPKGGEVMTKFLEHELAPIFNGMTEALVEATPEWWSSATLELVAPEGRLGSGLAHTISNAEYTRDLVVATDELLEATRALELASVRHGDSWKRCVFRIEQKPEGAWRFVVEFER